MRSPMTEEVQRIVKMPVVLIELDTARAYIMRDGGGGGRMY